MTKYASKAAALIDSCDKITNFILTDEPYREAVSALCSELSGFLPDILELYSRPEYISHIDDIPGWAQQLQRLMDAAGGNDTLLLLDIISYEIKYNLKEIYELTEGM